MGRCTTCDAEFDGVGLCQECLGSLGIREDTAEHVGLTEEEDSPTTPVDDAPEEP